MASFNLFHGTRQWDRTIWWFVARQTVRNLFPPRDWQWFSTRPISRCLQACELLDESLNGPMHIFPFSNRSATAAWFTRTINTSISLEKRRFQQSTASSHTMTQLALKSWHCFFPCQLRACFRGRTNTSHSQCNGRLASDSSIRAVSHRRH